MRTPEQVRAGRAASARRRRADPVKGEEIRRRQRRYYRESGAERQRERNAQKKREDFFAYHVQFARRFNRELTADDLRALWEAQGGRCALTGRPLEGNQPTLDHRVPATRGGSHGLENLRWTTRRANEAKGNLTDGEFLALCRDVLATL